MRTRTQGPHGDGDRAVSERPLGRDGSQRTAAGAGALGAADRGVAEAPSEEVATNPTTELPELTQDWVNRLLEGTNRTLCALGPRRKEQ